MRRAPFVLVLAALASASAFAAAGPRVHVRGSGRLQGQVARDNGALVLTGTLTDDDGEPLASEHLTFSIALESSPQTALSARAVPCPGGTAAAFATDEAGRFCIRVEVPRDRYVATVAWAGSTLVDATTLALPIDTERHATTLRFDPEPRVLSLDKPATVIGVVASFEENQTTHAAGDLPIEILDERDRPLASGMTSPGGTVRLSIPTERLGAAGRGLLRATFEGSADLVQGETVTPVEKQARVELSTTTQLSEPMSPEDGVSLAVVATAKGGAPPSGSVEALLGEHVVGAAMLNDGKATLVVTFVPATSQENDVAELTLRYLPDSPWFVRGDDTPLRMHLKGPSPWRKVPLAAFGLLVAAWVILGRVRTKEPRSLSDTTAPSPTGGEARVEVLRTTRGSGSGWTGRVVDAHDAIPVVGASVRVERPSFERSAIVARTVTDQEGRFTLASDGGTVGDLVVDGPLHAELRKPLPPHGELEVALVLRKRKLLERLVTWAKRRGRPFDGTLEPTPGHVRRVAGNDFAVARWADAVERAAFAGGAVDARLEAEIDAIAPAGAPVPRDPGLTVVDDRGLRGDDDAAAASAADSEPPQKLASRQGTATMPLNVTLPLPPRGGDEPK